MRKFHLEIHEYFELYSSLSCIVPTWVLVKRIAETGGSAENIQVENLKGYAGEMCQRSGDWYSPANQSQSRYFEQGEIFPEIVNNAWGETIWYLEVTNKN